MSKLGRPSPPRQIAVACRTPCPLRGIAPDAANDTFRYAGGRETRIEVVQALVHKQASAFSDAQRSRRHNSVVVRQLRIVRLPYAG